MADRHLRRPVSVRLADADRARLNAAADRAGISVNSAIQAAVRMWIEQMENEMGGKTEPGRGG